MYPESRISLADLKDDVEHLSSSSSNGDLLDVKTANEWLELAKSKSIPYQLFGPLWYQGELAILFADTNLGKSILAVQIANALTKQIGIAPFEECIKKLEVLYCDFELSDKQFENRYSADYLDHYPFSESFLRAELNIDEFLLKPSIPIEEQIGNEIERHIKEKKVDIVIIDNLTYIASEIEKSISIQPIMHKLRWICRHYNISILVLAHTPKRDLYKPLTKNDLAGSKFLSNASDSMIAIGKSSVDEMLRYVKQLKSRNAAFDYGEENVIVYSIEKEHNFLGFVYRGTDEERIHLRIKSNDELDDLDRQIIEEHSSYPSLSFSGIAKKLNTNKMRVKRVIDRNSNS